MTSFLFNTLTDNRMNHLSRLSEVMYAGLCQKIGTPAKVWTIRAVMDMDDMINSPIERYNRFGSRLIGSRREGFRFESSDHNYAFHVRDNIIIVDLSNLDNINIFNLNIVLMEHSETPPGYVKLNLLTSTRGIVQSMTVMTGHDRYISTKKFCRIMHRCGVCVHYFVKETEKPSSHCSGSYWKGNLFGWNGCLVSQCWPQPALSWIERCQHKRWPDQSVLSEIKSNGCYIMPIGSKSSTFGNALEWKLQFSQAEKILFYTMNHTQFLCYGVLYIFLNEVMCSPNQDSLICSYFLKTVLLWEIQHNPDSVFWCPSNLLSCFWICFKRLCKFVLDSNCPNFFIPENNMFQNEIVGASHETLLSQLIGFYKMGVSCLLLSPTFSSILELAIGNPSFVRPFSEGHVISKFDMVECIKKEFDTMVFEMNSKENCFLTLRSITNLLQLPLSQFQLPVLQYAVATALINAAFYVARNCAPNTNKTWYKLDRMIINALRLSSRIGPGSYILYLGVYYYNTRRYNETICICELLRQRLLQQTAWMYFAFQEGMYTQDLNILSKLMKNAWLKRINFSKVTTYIAELYSEYQESENYLVISPYVLQHMLHVLSSIQLGNMSLCPESPSDPRALLDLDDTEYNMLEPTDVSWQILGICQHVTGNLHGALRSYQMSLRQKSSNRIRRATETRIGVVLQQLHGR